MKRRPRRRKRKRYYPCCPDQVFMGGLVALVKSNSDTNEIHMSMYPCSPLERSIYSQQVLSREVG